MNVNDMVAIAGDMVTVGPGKYVIGDPCYVIPGDHWDGLLGTCEYFERPVGYVELGGIEWNILAFRTAHGDGTYTGSDGFEYGVDAGLIGLVPYELAISIGKYDPELSNTIEFDKPVTCHNRSGELIFGHVSINTDYDEEEEDQYDEWIQDIRLWIRLWKSE